MTLIDPLQLMTLMGTAPERSSRTTKGLGYTADKFQRQMDGAMSQTDGTSIPELNGSGMENILMRDALHGLTSLINQRRGTTRATSTASTGKHQDIGVLSAAFESGTQGVNAIGYDQTGGTSYGTYQIASKPGTMSRFIEYLNGEEPRWAAKLKAAGPANTGSTKGRMPETWASIAKEDPERFGQVQRDFIEATHYEPARDKILTRTGVDVDTLPKAAQEALWSTSVQHGPAGAAKIFGRIIQSIGGKDDDTAFAQKLINKVYDDRKGQFGSSTSSVQASVQGRMNVEKEMVLAMLGEKERRTTSINT